MMNRRIVKMGIAAVVAVVPLAVACTQTPADAQSGAKVRSMSQSERAQGAKAHPQLVEEFGGAYNSSQASYVTTVGRKIAVQSGLANAPSDYTITLLNSPVMNAFAIPGGYVYVTRQLVALMNDEAELASVLGHEVGHVAARHAQKRNTRSTIGSIGSVLLGVLTGSSELAQVAGQASQIYTLSYSRGQEYQADDLGIRYLKQSGYDPYAAADMLSSLGRSSALDAQLSGRDAEKAIPGWARSHPLTTDRVTRARKAAAATGATAGKSIRNRDTFLNALDGAIYDDDPKQGVVDGRIFRHPDLRFQFEAPTGFTIANGTQSIAIQGNGGQAQFMGGGLGGGGLDAYIGKVFNALGGGQQQISYSEPRRTTINGLEAATATARANTQSGPVDVTVTAYRWQGDQAFHFMTITPAGSGLGPFSGLINSLKRLSDAEAASIRPRVIDVVAVKSGDTLASLAGRMAYSDLRTERFLTLNARTSNQPLRPGERVKLIVYGQR